MIYASHTNTKATSQMEPIFGADMVENSAGGYVFALDDRKRFDRFLILGSEGGTYYASAKALTRENAECALRVVREDGAFAVARIVEISESGRAPKNDAALFALSLAASFGELTTRQAAFAALPRVARTASHLFMFLENIKKMRGFGRGVRRAVGNWYNGKEASALAYQLLKYRNRNGWTHQDVGSMLRVKPSSTGHQALWRYMVTGSTGEHSVTRRVKEGQKTQVYEALPADALPAIIADFEALQKAESVADVVRVVASNRSISWEMIPTKFLSSPEVWEALLPNLPMTALLRNLVRMTGNGLIAPLSNAARVVSERITNVEALTKSRVHPIAVLTALAAYTGGSRFGEGSSVNPVTQVTDALSEAFYLSFGNVTPTGKRIMKALDVSGSMGGGQIAGVPGLTPRLVSAALSLVSASVEHQCAFMAFSSEFKPIDISPRERLDDVVKKVEDWDFGDTDCALPMIYALERKIPVDIFEVYTDNETWAGDIHPVQALRRYRQETGIQAKLVVVGMTATNFTIADPDDSGMLDVVGCDTATPELISDFARE